MIGPILRAASYGDEKISPSVVAFSEKMMHDTPIATLVEFLHALEVHDETEALPILAKVPTLIACGDRDLLTPMEYSETMAAALPKSELVIVGGAGHLVQLEQPEAIDDALVRLGRARHPLQARRIDAAAARAGPAPWLRRVSTARRHRGIADHRRHHRARRPARASSCVPVTSWCLRAAWVRERRCWPRESRREWMWTGR